MTRAWDPATMPAPPTSHGTAGAVQRPDNLRLRPAGAAALAGSLPSPAPQAPPANGGHYLAPALSAAAAARERTARIRAAAQEPAAESDPTPWPETAAQAPASAWLAPDELPLATPRLAPQRPEAETTQGPSVAEAAQARSIPFRPLRRAVSAPEAPPPSAPEAPAPSVPETRPPRVPLFPPAPVFRSASAPTAIPPASASAPQPAPAARPGSASAPRPAPAAAPASASAPQPAPAAAGPASASVPEPAAERTPQQRRFAKTLADLERYRDASEAQVLPEAVEDPRSLWSRLWSWRKDSALR